ncbi:peptidase E [Bacillus sp. M6-12]|uniref:Type 1 glutamine amidotransferase-like domain-containing protein n=1 Tax=Bacillus sp. M6-12 TaxID=2054166 RepID=UPI000C78EFB2|nr:peptidase E [Bacillus sp. M6-12]PLS17114.1 peptidase E [Bacillus sp. M6-12]
MKQIFAMGGGGFSMEPENLALDKYLLAQSEAKVPKVCFIPTASGDSEGYIKRFYAAFETLDCTPSHLSLFKPPTQNLEDFVLDRDIIYAGGGNTKNLLVLWREWGLDKVMKKAWENGVILAGISAGSICWFEEGVTDSFGPLRGLSALGFLKGSNCPHYDGESERRPSYHSLIKSGLLQEGFAADDGAALHFVGDELSIVVTSRPNARAYYVRSINGQVEEEKLEHIYLG